MMMNSHETRHEVGAKEMMRRTARLPNHATGLTFNHLNSSCSSSYDEDEAVIWRGPRKNGLIKQFLKDTEWGALDYLVVDAPPGRPVHSKHATCSEHAQA